MSRVFKWIRRLAVLGFSLAVLGIVALLVLVWIAAPQLPDVQVLKNVELQVPMTVFSQDEKLIAQFGETRRYPAKIDEIPDYVKQAVISVEDSRFYAHSGLDWRGIARAIWLLASTTDDRVPGGSTITQQVARNFFLSTEYSFRRKFMEMLLALKMERELSKDEILELYLNKIFFGNRAYGIGAAAEFYYGKRLDELSLAESATLAGVPKFPSTGNPITNPKRATERRNYILRRMNELGYISEAQMREAQASVDQASPHEPAVEVEAPYLAEMVRQFMEQRYGPSALTDGYRVVTTVTSNDQNAAATSVRAGLIEYDQRRGWRSAEANYAEALAAGTEAASEKLRSVPGVLGYETVLVERISDAELGTLNAQGENGSLPPTAWAWTNKVATDLFKRGDVVRVRKLSDGTAQIVQIPQAQSALVSLDADTGALKALVGGFSFNLNKFNRATQAQRQPGSSFKPFVYASAFERGYSPATVVMDAPVVFRERDGKEWRPQNDNESFAGPMRLREAMVQSRNLVSVRILDSIGVQFASRYITNFGFPSQSLPPNLSMALGSASLTPLSIARGYTAFANGGMLVEPHFIDQISDREGTVIFKMHPSIACQFCPERRSEQRVQSRVVDGFNFGPAAAPRQAAQVPAYNPNSAGPPPYTLAPRAIDERTAFLVNSLLLDVVRRGTGTAANVLGRSDVGGKTGSTNDHRDAWFSGFGGNTVTTVWVGRDDFEPLGRGEYGGRAALPIWIGFMAEALKDEPSNTQRPPSGIMTITVDKVSGALVPEGSADSVVDFVKTEDYDRILSAGLISDEQVITESAFEVF